MTAEIAKIIEDGLRWYEEELWHDRRKPMEKTVKVISQEELQTQIQGNNEGTIPTIRVQGKSSILSLCHSNNSVFV